uniref:Trafficking protein particle complex subunit n=1 Tax=Rhizochromulina marina TaxID=1034831 RepID=A0A7S2SEE0_9STRA
MASKSHVRVGEQAWARTPKVNGEFFAMTYGALVMQIIEDHEDVDLVNKQLEKIGYNIGVRIIDEFLAKSGLPGPCQSHRETADSIAKVAFKMFLGITADVTSWNAERSSFCLTFYENPLTEFVELPAEYTGLVYSNILCGAIRGALEMIQVRAQCKFVRDTLKGDDVNEIQVEIQEVMEEVMSEDYKDNS